MEADNNNPDKPSAHEKQARREFLKKVGKTGATVPAVALLMAANFKTANANDSPYNGNDCGGCGCGPCP